MCPVQIPNHAFPHSVKCERGVGFALMFFLAFYVWGYCVMRACNMITHYSNVEDGEVVCASCENGTIRLSLHVVYFPMMWSEESVHDLRMFEVYGHPSPKQWIAQRLGLT